MQTLARAETSVTWVARAHAGVSPRPPKLPASGREEADWAPIPSPGGLARVAALLVSISHNNGYEGRDPMIVPDTLTSGFVADLLGTDVGGLAELLVELKRRGVIDSGHAGLKLKDIAALEALADLG